MVCESYHDSLIDLPERPVSVDPENNRGDMFE